MTRAEWVRGFWRRVIKLGATACWPWTGTLKDGYGQLKRQDGQTNIYAHRASVEIAHGVPVPSHLVVMHRCDNPRCVNPLHLKVGTQLENVRDMHAKGRQSTVVLRGDQHGSTKVSDASVRIIRKLWADRHKTKLTQSAIAEHFGITQAQVSRIVNGKRRK
jgi:hypothetical protein